MDWTDSKKKGAHGENSWLRRCIFRFHNRKCLKRTKFGEQKQEVLSKTSEFHPNIAFSFFSFSVTYVNLWLTVSVGETWGRQLLYYGSFFHNEENETVCHNSRNRFRESSLRHPENCLLALSCLSAHMMQLCSYWMDFREFRTGGKFYLTLST
jgi:hypothetical protein